MKNFASVLSIACLLVSHLSEGLNLRQNERIQQENINVTFGPTDSPVPSPSPSSTPSMPPTISKAPSAFPTGSPGPTLVPSDNPTDLKSSGPTESPKPSPSPSKLPTALPSNIPSDIPSQRPSLSHEPSISPTLSIEPSSAPTTSLSPSLAPSTDTVIMSGLLTVSLPGVKKPMDEDMMYLFAFVMSEFIRDHAPPDTEVLVQPLTVSVTNQSASPPPHELMVTVNVTSLVGSRPLPADFNYTEHIGYGFENSTTIFLEAFDEAQDERSKPKPGVGNVAFGQQTTGNVDNSEKKWSNAAIGFMVFAIIVLLILLIILCMRLCCCCGGGGVEEEVLKERAAGDLVLYPNDPSWEEASPSSPTGAGDSHNVPRANVHKCKSSSCQACIANREGNKATFVPVSPTKRSMRAVFGSLSPRSKFASGRPTQGMRK